MMVDEIRQELGFDASQALATLAKLDKAMATYDTNLGKSVRAMGAFNAAGGKTVSVLKRLTSDGAKAAAELAKVAALKGQIASTGLGAPGVARGQIAGVDRYVKQMQSMYKVSEKATGAQKRAFQSAITSAAEFAAKSKISMGSVVKQSRNLDKSFTGTANSMANKLAKIDQAAKKHLDAAGQSTRKLTVDFQTMVRIISTQAIVRALSTLRNLIRGAVSDAVEFQTSIAEIGTIAPIDDLADLGARVQEISKEFNTPLDTTAKGYYQTISNQIGQSTDEFDKFMQASARFSKTSVTDMASAVNLGSGTLNAFGKSAEDAEDMFAKFFMTIKKGRIVGAELAQGYGTVAPLAGKLNVEMEELNAAMATITIQGVAADKAFTQLRGIFNSFLKPTKEMKAALKELGYENGEQILKAYDLQTALKMVIGTTDGSSEAVAKFIPRIRGITGGLALLDDKTGHFNATMEAQKKLLQETYGRGYNLVMETDAQKITKELNKLKIFMTTEFGAAILGASVEMSKMVGGAEGIIEVLSAIGPQLPKVVVGITAMGTAFAFMAIRARAAQAGVMGLKGGLLSVLALAPVAMAAGDFIAKRIVSSWTQEQKTFAKLMAWENDARKRKIESEISAEKNKVNEIEQLLEREFAGSRNKYFDLTDAAVDGNERILDVIKHYTGAMIREQDRYAQKVKQAALDSTKNVYESEKRSAKLRTGIDDRLFKHRTDKLEETHQVYRYVAKADEIARKAAASLSKARGEDQRASATEEFSRAAAFAEQALNVAKGTDNRALEAKALGMLETIQERNISAEQSYQHEVQKSQQMLMREAQEEERRAVKMKELQKDLLEAYQLYDKETGELLGAEERADKLQDAHKKLGEFLQTAAEGKPLDVAQMLDFANLSKKMAGEVADFRVEELNASAQSLQDLHDQVQKALTGFYAEVPVAKMLKEETGIEVTGEKSKTEAMEALKQKTLELNDTSKVYSETLVDLSTKERELTKAFKEAGEHMSSQAISAAIVDSNRKGSQNKAVFLGMAEAVKLTANALSGGAVAMDEFTEANQKLLRGEAQQGAVSTRVTGPLKADIEEMMRRLGEYIKLQETLDTLQTETGTPLEEVRQKAAEIDTQIRSLLTQPKTDAQAMSTAVGSAAMSTSLAVDPTAQLSTHWANIATSAQRAATAAARLGQPTAMTTAMSARGGMMRYLASGGAARGTDKILARLSAGEVVTNAKASRRFYSQLSAMNADVEPVYRASGGDVYNTTIGDINVTEAKRPGQTGREVMARIRRENRRGSSRL